MGTPGSARVSAGLIRAANAGPNGSGWHNLDGWALHRGSLADPTVAIQFWQVGQVYGHPCQWQGTLSDPGRSVDDLADALKDIPLRNATPPVDVVLDDRSGSYLEWSVPADIHWCLASPPPLAILGLTTPST